MTLCATRIVERWLPPAAVALCLLLCCSCGGGAEKTTADQSLTEQPAAEASAKTVQDGSKPAPAPLDVQLSLHGPGVRVEFIDNLPGDYNSDGVVGGQDVFPLALHFNEADDSCIDGNGDGVIDGLDLFLVATWFGSSVSGYEVVSYGADNPASPRTETDEPIEYLGCGGTHVKTFINQVLPRYYSVVPLSGGSDQPGEASALQVIQDDRPPLVYYQPGLTWAIAADGAALLKWNTASDEHSEQVFYHVYWDTQSPIRFGEGAQELVIDPEEAPWGASTRTAITGLENGRPYWCAVRASDSASPPNWELNTVELMVEPTAWGRELIDDWGIPSGDICLVVDDDGNPAVAWFEQTNLRVQFARRVGSAWEKTTLSIEQSRPEYLAMVVLPSSEIGVRWRKANGDIYWAVAGRDGIEIDKIYWNVSDRVTMSLIETDSNGNPGFVTGSNVTDQIQYARMENGVWKWSTALVDMDRQYDYLGLAYDESDTPAIALYKEWQYFKDNTLRFYTPETPEWRLADEITGIRFFSRMDFLHDADGDLVTFCKPSGLSYYYSFGLLRRVGADWETEEVGLPGYPEVTSAALDADGNLMLLYSYDDSVITLDGKRFVRLVDGEWQMQIIAPGAETIGAQSLALDADGNPLAAIYQEDENALYLYGPGL